MAKNPDQPHDRPEWRRSEARLKEFMRRASPIVAAERGWNERSQAKLRMLADDLELPAHLYDVAVDKLRQGELHFEDQLTAAEQQYANYLRTHFGRSKIRVLTGTHEKRAVRIARREYEIPQSRARQLVRQVAAELGISRVSRLDAEQYVADLIEETIGQSANISDRVRGRIFAAGSKWGVETRQVEILINNRLEANRQAIAPGHPWLVRWMAICLSILVMTLLARFGYVLFTSSNDPDAGKTGDEIENRDAGAADARLAAPFWWSEKTREAFDAFTLNPRTARFPHEVLIDIDRRRRHSGYRSVIQLISESPGIVAEQCTELFACCFADESTSNALVMPPLITELDKLTMDRLPPGIRVYLNQWHANELLTRCASKNIGTQKIAALNDVSRALTGIALSPTGSDSEYSDRSRFALAGRQWDHVNSLGFQSPELAARLFGPLSDLTRDRLGQPHPAEFSTAISLLSVRPAIWTLLRDPLQRLIREIDDDQVLQLFTLGSRSNLAELQSWLALRLAERLGITTERRSRQWVETAIQSQLGMAPTSSNIFLPRRQKLMDLVERNGVFDELLPADPQSIATAAHFTTIALLLEHSEQGGNRELLSSVDDLLNRSPRNLAVRTSQTRTRTSLPVYRRVARRALPSDRRSRDEALEALADAQTLNDQARA
ncbi:MAG: hypothetical protein ACR2NP_08110, partial [Pirellulaceae bacterium]